MTAKVKFFHPDETLEYNIEKSFCKVVFQDNGYYLLLEIYSTDELDHVEEDSIQNEYPQIVMSIDDFPMNFTSLDDLDGNRVEIPNSSAELLDEDGETQEVYYTNLSSDMNDYELNHNELNFYKNDAKELCVQWKGVAEDFTEETNNGIPFEVVCSFSEKEVLV